MERKRSRNIKGERENKKKRSTQKFTSQMAQLGLSQAKEWSQELNLHLLDRWQEGIYISHHLLLSKVRIIGKLKSGAEQRLEPRNSAMGCGSPN